MGIPETWFNESNAYLENLSDIEKLRNVAMKDEAMGYIFIYVMKFSLQSWMILNALPLKGDHRRWQNIYIYIYNPHH